MPNPKVEPGASVGALAKFADVGIRLSSDVWTMDDKRYSLKRWWIGDGRYDWDLFDRLAHGLLDASRDGFIFPRIKIDPPDGWHGIDPSSAEWPRVSSAWRNSYRRMMRDMVRHVESSDYADRVIGYQLGALHCGEWLWSLPYDAFPPVVGGCRDPLPPYAASAARRAAMNAYSEAIADAAVEAGAALRALVGRRKLIGCFWGYPWFAHEKFQRVLDGGVYDFFAAPPHYGETREPGHSGASQVCYTDSFRLHGKVFYEETDFRSLLSDPACAPKGQTRMRSIYETVNLIRRSIGKCLVGGHENWWFLLGGNSTFDSPAMMESIRVGVAEERKTLLSAVWTPAEVAVFTSSDEYATSSLSGNDAFRVECKMKPHQEVLPFCGVPYDSYELSDIADSRLPDYKVYVFLNAFTVDDDIRTQIKKRLRRSGKTTVWIYAPGYFRNGTESVANIADLTGVEVVEHRRDDDPVFVRTFKATECEVYNKGGWRSVYLPVPPDADHYREIFRQSGAHVWCETRDVIAAGRGYLMLHAASDGEKVIHLPMGSNVREIFDTSPERDGVSLINEYMRRGETRTWRLCPQVDSPKRGNCGRGGIVVHYSTSSKGMS